MQYKRYFLIEPNLKKTFGHVTEFPFALRDYLKRGHKEVYVVCNKDIDKAILRSQDNLRPFITQGCFDDLSDNGSAYYHDLVYLDEQFKLDSNDLIINLTSYTNEILGVEKYLNYKSDNSARFCLWFHQLYPPSKIFTETLSTRYQKRIHQKMIRCFKTVEGRRNVYIFTTPSKKLNATYRRLSSRRICELPLPYSKIVKYNRDNRGKLVFGFLGDGRYEKGLPLILESIIKTKDQTNKYIIETIFPRGYSESDLSKLYMFESEIRSSYRNVSLIKKPLSNHAYKRVFKKIDVLLLPYHPKSYDKRVSGIFIEAGINGIPVIVASSTWMAEQVKKDFNGITFDYNSGIGGLSNAIYRMTLDFGRHKKNAETMRKRYQKIYTPENFMSVLSKYTN